MFGLPRKSCSAYRGKVSGGIVDRVASKIVEAYDHTVDEWVEMASMVDARYYHSQVTVKNKLFIIGSERESCEVFDVNCGKFELISDPKRSLRSEFPTFQVVSIGDKIVVYDYRVHYFSCYDVEKDEWTEEAFELSKKLNGFVCVKVPQLNI